MTLPGLISLLILLTVTLLGGFTRPTHRKYTPGFYAYQLDRAPDNASTRIIPYVDFTVAALLRGVWPPCCVRCCSSEASSCG